MSELMKDDDKEFRDKRTWSTFKAVTYTGVATASFIGVMNKIVGAGIDALNGTVSTAEAFGVPTTLFMAGVMAVGALFTYMAQKEWTYTKILEDDHLAHKNALCMGHSVSHEHALSAQQSHGAVHDHHQRKDGKSWTQVVSKPKEAEVTHHLHI